MSGKPTSVAVGILLALVLCQGPAGASPIESPSPTVYAKGLRARIGGTRLRAARLVFAERHVTVDLRGHGSEHFAYETIRFQRARATTRRPLPDKKYWYSILPAVPLFWLLGPYSLAGYLAGTHAWELSSWLASRGSRPRLDLHSDEVHRCSQVALPRDAKLRKAILDEFARRFAGKLRTRSPNSFSPQERESFPTRGNQAPDFTLTAVNGMSWSLSRMRGYVVLVNFWASWCEPCLQELPHLQQLQEQYSDDGLVVLGVSDEVPSKLRPYLEEYGVGYPSLHDPDGSVMRTYQINAIPTSLIIGRDGQLQQRMEGFTPASAFEKALKPLLARTSGAPGH